MVRVFHLIEFQRFVQSRQKHTGQDKTSENPNQTQNLFHQGSEGRKGQNEVRNDLGPDEQLGLDVVLAKLIKKTNPLLTQTQRILPELLNRVAKQGRVILSVQRAQAIHFFSEFSYKLSLMSLSTHYPPLWFRYDYSPKVHGLEAQSLR